MKDSICSSSCSESQACRDLKNKLSYRNEAIYVSSFCHSWYSAAAANRHTLLGLSQTNRVVTKIIDAVPLPQESVSQDGKGTNRLGEVHPHKGADAGALDL